MELWMPIPGVGGDVDVDDDADNDDGAAAAGPVLVDARDIPKAATVLLDILENAETAAPVPPYVAAAAVLLLPLLLPLPLPLLLLLL